MGRNGGGAGGGGGGCGEKKPIRCPHLISASEVSALTALGRGIRAPVGHSDTEAQGLLEPLQIPRNGVEVSWVRNALHSFNIKIH